MAPYCRLWVQKATTGTIVGALWHCVSLVRVAVLSDLSRFSRTIREFLECAATCQPSATSPAAISPVAATSPDTRSASNRRSSPEGKACDAEPQEHTHPDSTRIQELEVLTAALSLRAPCLRQSRWALSVCVAVDRPRCDPRSSSCGPEISRQNNDINARGVVSTTTSHIV